MQKLKHLLHRGIDRFQKHLPPNRIVVLLTPLVFVPAAAGVSAWVAEHFPGVSLSEEAIVGFAAAGAISALATAYKWIDGWQAEEAAFNDMWTERELRKPWPPVGEE